MLLEADLLIGGDQYVVARLLRGGQQHTIFQGALSLLIDRLNHMVANQLPPEGYRRSLDQRGSS